MRPTRGPRCRAPQHRCSLTPKSLQNRMTLAKYMTWLLSVGGTTMAKMQSLVTLPSTTKRCWPASRFPCWTS